MIALGGCGGGADKPRAEPAADEASRKLGVALNEEQRGKLGVELGEVAAATFQPTLDGPARIIDAQTVVVAMADLDKATAEARTSEVALKRARDLYRADKTVSAETLEAAERQAATDQAQLAVARAACEPPVRRRAVARHGTPRRAARVARARRHAAREREFPFGPSCRATRESRAASVGTQIGEFWITTQIWTGPSDPSVPGRRCSASCRRPRD